MLDEIVIGSGLSALATVQGLLDAGRSVLVIAGQDTEDLRTYAFAPAVPCANLGRGGLGEYWHGVIPTASVSGQQAQDYLSRYFPAFAATPHAGGPALLVPWKPIRPRSHFDQLTKTHPDRLTVRAGHVDTVRLSDGGADIALKDRELLSAKRVWLAAGALHTPGLISELVGQTPRRVSDHIIGYAGQVRQADLPADALVAIRRTRDGVMLPAFYSEDGAVLYTLRPARFDFARLDEGIEKRSVFGLPTKKVVAGLLGRFSPGLLSEALYNKTGLFPKAGLYSLYFQTVARNVYAYDRAGNIVEADQDKLAAAAQTARKSVPFADVRLSQRPELLIPGIHLHGSLPPDVTACSLNEGPIKIADPSCMTDIGPNHHSFAMMVKAYVTARDAT